MDAILQAVESVNGKINGVVWGAFGLLLLVGTGVIVTCLTKFFQVTHIGMWFKHTLGSLFNKDVIKLDKGIALGAGGAPMNGGIDEFRLWGKSIGFIEDICNKHMNNPEEYVASDTLMVYYDFNQNSGDVIDRSGNGNHGVRTGFGPDAVATDEMTASVSPSAKWGHHWLAPLS